MTETTTNQIQPLIDAVQKADSAPGLLQAVTKLAEVRSPLAIPTLVQVLGFNNPGASVAAVEGLIGIGEETVPYLLNNLDPYNYGARAWAIRVFAGIGDPRALDLLLKAASSDFSLSVRRAAARGLGMIKWEQIPTSELEQVQIQVLDTLLLTSDDGEWVVRYATVVALENLAKALKATDFELRERIRVKLKEMLEQDRELGVKARVKLALSKIGIWHSAFGICG
jgi:phycocyanobilin lyase beta subunit